MTTGWISHLYYWIYPGIMVAYIATLISYVVSLFHPTFSANWASVVAVASAVVVGGIAYRGITGSTITALAINVIQLVMLVIVSILAIVFRLSHSGLNYAHSSALDVITPHSLSGVVYQGTIAILLLVGFESVTALGAEAKDPKRHIRRAILLSLTIQGLLAYLFEYFAANYFLGDHIVGTMPDTSPGAAAGATVAAKGIDAAANSSAPLGDFVKYMGDNWFSSLGIAFACIVAVTVVLALIGTCLSAMNTGVRITYAMGRDREMPGLLGFLHGRFATPHWGVVAMVVVAGAFGAYGARDVDKLTQITLASNTGTFILYGITCLLTLLAFWSHGDHDILRHKVVPIVGAFLNIFMMLAVFYVAFSSGGNSADDGQKALYIVAVWIVLGVVWYIWNSTRQRRAMLSAPATPA